jgi:glycine cleavage system H lipoate-binding protein
MKKKGKARHRRSKRIIGFQVLEDECIWMKAGVVNFRTCDQAYDCNNCAFDKGMRKAMKISAAGDTRVVAPKWVAYLQKNYHGASRPCRHSLTGRIDAPKICSLNYECYHCAFDQMLDEVDVAQEPNAPAYHLVSGYKLANDYYYHMGHSWIRFEHGGRVRIGLDDFIAKLFGALDELNLPPLGERLKQHRVGMTFGRGSQQAAILSPASGTVLAVNHRAREHPQIAHEDPYREGWLMILEPASPKRDLKGLYFGEEGFRWMEQEVEKIMGMLGQEYEKLAATGGEPIGDVYGNFPELDWDVLVKQFLGTKRI